MLLPIVDFGQAPPSVEAGIDAMALSPYHYQASSSPRQTEMVSHRSYERFKIIRNARINTIICQSESYEKHSKAIQHLVCVKVHVSCIHLTCLIVSNLWWAGVVKRL